MSHGILCPAALNSSHAEDSREHQRSEGIGQHAAEVRTKQSLWRRNGHRWRTRRGVDVGAKVRKWSSELWKWERRKAFVKNDVILSDLRFPDVME